MKNRNANLDFIRVLAMVMVVAVHATPFPWADNAPVRSMIRIALLSCNSLFFMLSGQLNLTHKFREPRDYYQYYVKKIITILLPYIAVTCLLSVCNMHMAGQAITVRSYLKNTYIELMQKNATIYLWFMYPLCGMLLSTPFLAKMLDAMTDFEIKILFGVSIFWNVISIYLTVDVGVGFAYSAWLLSGWIFSFFAGYFCSRIINDRNKKILYICGLAGYIITVLGYWLIPDHYQYEADLAITHVAFAMAVYVFFSREISIKNERVKKVIYFISKHSFVEYMIHMMIYQRITVRLVESGSSLIAYFEAVMITLAISFLIAVILDVCIINPVQKALRKAFL